MYDLRPTAVFAHRRVLDHPRALARMERLCAAMQIRSDQVEIVTYDDIDRIIDAAGAHETIAADDLLKAGHGRVRQGHDRHFIDPVMVFSTFDWDQDQPPPRKFRHPRASALSLLLWGAGTGFAFSRREMYHGQSPYGWICQGGWGLHSASGCVHKCDYCGLGQLVVLQLDIEDLADRLEIAFAERPHQNLYRYDLNSDIPCFEPEYDAYRVFAERCAKWGDRYILIYTKSNNVDWLLDLPHKRHLPFYMTLSMDTVSREIERNTPTLEERIEAMRKCQEAGYVVRAGFTPIIPIAGWREETTAMIELLFSRCRPDVVRVWTLSMMDAREFRAMYGVERMDPYFMRRVAEEEERMNGTHKAPFPADVRAEIYQYYLDEIRRVSPETPVALCTEDPDVWDRLEDQLAMTRTEMFCCCGGTSVPGTFVPAA